MVLGAPADRERVLAVGVPVADENGVVGPAVRHDGIGAGGQAVFDVVQVASPDGEGVDAVTVPVADEDVVGRRPVGELDVGLRRERVGQVEAASAPTDRSTLGRCRRQTDERPGHDHPGDS
ncbi:hypothetical protein [Georgenia sp. SUBG003]|uniref:hypothetical protein n=1 Tax=Georgenia sp. SUBG003 TaxID=1497974 RepID=UPI003AB70C12